MDSVKLGLAPSCGTDLVFIFSRRIFFFLLPNPQASDKDLSISCFYGWGFLALLSQRGYHEWVSSLHKDFSSMRFPDGSVVKNLPANARRYGFNPQVGRIPQRRKWQPIPVFLPGKAHGQRSLAGYSPQDHRRIRHNLVAKQQQSVLSPCLR